MFGAIGVLGALCARDRTGRGQAVDVSGMDAMFSLIDCWVSMHAVDGRLPRQVGNRHLGTAPYDCYRAKDGWVVIAVGSNKLFRRLAAAIGRTELGEDPRFRGVGGRVKHTDEINGIVGAWVGEHTVEQVVAALGPGGAGVPCSPVHTVDQLLGHPQLLARRMLERLPHQQLGEIVVPGVVPKLSDTPGAIHRLGPALGEHTEQVYRELLGLGDEELARLRAARVICPSAGLSLHLLLQLRDRRPGFGQLGVALREPAFGHRQLALDVDLLVPAVDQLGVQALGLGAQRRGTLRPVPVRHPGREEAEAEDDGQHQQALRPLPHRLLDPLLCCLVVELLAHGWSPFGRGIATRRACIAHVDGEEKGPAQARIGAPRPRSR